MNERWIVGSRSTRVGGGEGGIYHDMSTRIEISILVKYSHNHGLGQSGLVYSVKHFRSLSFLFLHIVLDAIETKIFIWTFSLSNIVRLSLSA